MKAIAITTSLLTLQMVLCALPVFAQSKPLEAHVEHSEKLPPVPEGLMQGGKFDEQSLPKLVPKNLWVPIPKWLAGTWQFKSETCTHMNVIKDKVKYPPCPFVLRNEFQKTFGYQVDKNGQVWDYIRAPWAYTSKVDNNCLAYNRCTSTKIVDDAEDNYTRSVVGDDSIVEPKSQLILITLQKECISRYTPMPPDAIRIDASTKVFDTNGDTKILKISNMMGAIAKPFEVINEKDGDDLKKLFAEYLTSVGKTDLIPDK